MVARHKLVKNMSLDDQLEDDALSDGGEDYISDEHQALLNDGLDQVREVIGGADHSGLSDAAIKDVLWECDFDIEETIQWAIEQQERNRLAQERKGKFHNFTPSRIRKDLPPVPQPPEQRELGYGEYSPPVLGPRSVIQEETVESEERSHVPLIVLAQQKQQLNSPDLRSEVTEVTGAPVKRNLSTITEMTERTEIWPTRPQHLSLSLPRPPSSVTTSYGLPVEPVPTDSVVNSVDPDLIPVSPSGSALHRLSFYEPAPSMPPSETGSSESYLSPKAPSEPVPPLDTIPDIPDLNSKSSRQITQKPTSQTGKKSKLAMLATSRATTSSTRSESSRSTGTDVIGSVKTYPGLRPTSQSIRPPSSIASTSPPSSTSSHVRRAIQTALEMEAGDRSPASQGDSDGSRTPTPTLHRPSAPTPSKLPQMPTPSSSPPTTRQPSKLALLAQANKAARSAKPVLPLSGTPPQLPPEHTEYLTPISNGPTVTTAITTSYQSFYSLTNPDRPSASTEPFVVPLSTSPSAGPSAEVKKSKLAMKIKKAQEKQQPPPVAPEAPPPPPIPPIFLPKPTRTRAAPSAFASLLVDDVPDDEATRLAKQKKLKGKQPEAPRHKGKHPTKTPDFYGLAREREKAQKLLAQKQMADAKSASSSRAASPIGSAGRGGKKTASATPQRAPSSMDQRQLDLSGLNLLDKEVSKIEEAPKMTFAHDKLLEEVKKTFEAQAATGKQRLSLVVIGHVDAGKSTLMGRLLYELGRMDERTRIANERNSTKVGKSSFSWAWGLDGTTEERERGITMDVALESFATTKRQVTVLDAPGHKEFIPNMISGASRADCALLVVDASNGEFEAGFERGGQTREHLVLARSLGVAQVIVAINKLDQVQWEKDRYEDICTLLRPFLVQSGFHPSKTSYVPIGAISGVNLVACEGNDAAQLLQWYKGPTLVDLLDKLEPPQRDIASPARIPISNIFKGQGSGISVSGRLLSGVVQVGERLRILPGDETAVVKSIEVEEENVPWAAAGSNLTLALVSVDPIQLTIGSVLCPPSDPVPLASTFTARILIFDIQVPIISGAMVELFFHSRDVPATISKLIATLDRTSSKVVKSNPRRQSVLAKASSAEVQITIRQTGSSGRSIPVELYAVNKAMGRILIRREGETIAAGIVTEIVG
ncbi:HBS1-like protein [Mycena sanguinolenta]|uniref:Elongation factor 1 alpha-like protein n=1 Tax=Mycena sanguinolenta TaxID=230812 RepID=A0A8H6YAX0_9AGAR|nr:HBS1-like protein [Mycena sanguinolenta]